jgi:hypothetical protein
MGLMTEVFNAWAAENVQKQPLPYAQPYAQPAPYSQQHNPYAQPPQYGQPWQQQQPYPQTQAAYNYGSPAGLPAQPVRNSIAPAMPSPAPTYTSPVPHNVLPNGRYGYGLPQGGAVEMPAELPGETLMVTAAPVPVQSISTDVSSSSVARLARDLWGADSRLEEEKVDV